MAMKLVAIVLLLVVGGAAVVVALGGLPRSAAAATTFLTATAEVSDVRDDVAATGSVASKSAWDLAFGADPVASDSSDGLSSASNDGGDTGTWVVSTVRVAVGDTVTKGQVLATATNPALVATIVAARNSWTIAALQEDVAHEAYEDATGDDAIRQARTNWLNAKNQLASAHRALLDAKAAAAKHHLVAPAAGVVTDVSIAAGAEAPSGAAITIASTDYAVTADVVESDIASMKLGQGATVTVAAIGATIEGTVTAIAPTAEASSSGNSGVVSYAVTVSLAKPPVELRAGMTAEITITTASATNVLAVPAAAVRGVGGSYSVLVMTAAGTPEPRAVTVGLMTSSLVEIRSGLSAGDVVVSGTSSAQRTNNSPNGPGGFAVPGGGGRVTNGNGPIIETKP